jgi:predicted Zn-dependent peptidase
MFILKNEGVKKLLRLSLKKEHDPYAHFEGLNLPNGLSVFAKELDVPWICVGFVCHVGAREDPVGRQGMAHLVEHLTAANVRNWTYSHFQSQLKALAVQANFGEVNYLATKYSLFLPALEDGLEEALTLFGEMLLAARLTRGIEAEKADTMREYARDYPFEEKRIWKLVGQQALFENHPRLRRYDTALGNPDEVNACAESEIQAFYDQYYTPHNISVVSIGHISPQEMREALQKSPFGASKAGNRNTLPAPFSVQPPQKQELMITLSDLSTLSFSQAECEFRWALPATVDYAQLWLFMRLLKTRLTQVLRYLQRFTYKVEVSSVTYQDCRNLCISVEVPSDAVRQTQEILWQVLGTLEEHEKSFDETRNAIINELICSDCSGRGIGRLVMKDLEVHQRLISFQDAIQDLEQVSFSQIVQLAAYLSPERQFRLIIQP